nr:unnamed protein product [Spirometra erinaceieuropaei]
MGWEEEEFTADKRSDGQMHISDTVAAPPVAAAATAASSAAAAIATTTTKPYVIIVKLGGVAFFNHNSETAADEAAPAGGISHCEGLADTHQPSTAGGRERSAVSEQQAL